MCEVLIVYGYCAEIQLYGGKVFLHCIIPLLLLYYGYMKTYGYVVLSKPEGHVWPNVNALLVFQGKYWFTACLLAISSGW